MAIGQFVFNETSPAAAGTVASSSPVSGGPSDSAAGVAFPLRNYDSIEIEAELKGATGGALDVYVQSSDDGIVWYDTVHFAQLAGSAAAIIYRTALSRYATAVAAPTVVGKNLTPALPVASAIQNGFGDHLRLVMVAGTSTSVGAPVLVRLTGFETARRG
jgi:hypothetical protein